MKQHLLSFYAGPVVALGALVAVSCLAGSWSINRLQSELTRAIRHDAAEMEAAVELQVQLRHLRVHSLVFAAQPTDARLEVVRADFGHVENVLAAIQATAASSEDVQLVERIQKDYARYKESLELDRLPNDARSMKDLAQWSDAHHMSELLEPCRELADRQRDRMSASLARSEDQSNWAGRVLFGLGIGGILAGLLSGYVVARRHHRQVAQLSVRVQAVQAQLDQEVGALTVRGPSHFGELDDQLDRVVGRVTEVCRKLQAQERELLRAEQLAAVGRLAAGVAHEVRNPLTGVKLLLQAAARTEAPVPLTDERIHLLLQEVARIERTVQGLMDFSRGPSPNRQLHDISSIIASALAVTQSRAEVKSIAIRMDRMNRPLNVVVDHDQLLSLLTNLLINAIDAAPVGGEIRVTAQDDFADEIRVDVTDSGPGIDHRVADRLFTPFATTKATGTGLGLTVAQRVAREHGGTLFACNRPGGGACFTLTLPSAEKANAQTSCS